MTDKKNQLSAGFIYLWDVKVPESWCKFTRIARDLRYYETTFFEIMTNHNQSYARISYVFMMRGYNYKFSKLTKIGVN